MQGLPEKKGEAHHVGIATDGRHHMHLYAVWWNIIVDALELVCQFLFISEASHV
jgi:hypothetical protein